MDVSIVGSGYVGTTAAACLADHGHRVVNVEIDEGIVAAINAGEAPIHEPGLAERIERHGGDRLRATTDYDAVRQTAVTLLCLPTPQAADGSLDLTAIRAGSESLGRALAGLDRSHVVAVKSTVLPGTTTDVVGEIVGRESGLAVGEDLLLAANPEFQRAGTAVTDFENPDKIVIGARDDRAVATLRELYAELIEGEGPRPLEDGDNLAVEGEGDRPGEGGDPHVVETGIPEAELIKYANNAFLAAKLSIVNELGNASKEYGADARAVLDAVGLDGRIGSRYMRSGLGWGGSCLPKDVDALRAGLREEGYEPELLDAVVAVNDRQPRRLVDLLARHVDLDGARVAVLGLAFKPDTDDVRGSRALDVVEHLRAAGAEVVAYDPVAAENALERDPDLSVAPTASAALSGADAAVIATPWDEFESLSFDGMDRRVVIDGRGIDVDRDALEVYEGLCW